MKKLFLGFLLIFLSSCMATPQIQLKSGDMAMEFKCKAYFLDDVAFSPDGQYALTGSEDKTLRLWNIAAGKEIRQFIGHAGLVRSAVFSPDGKYVLSAGDDASTKLWNIATGEEIATMIGFEDGEWIVVTPNGYYNSSPKGDQCINVKVGDKNYTIEQLREAFYRPDLVNLALSGGSLKEFKKLADVKQPPTVSIVDTPKNTTKDEAAITLKIVDIGGGIGDKDYILTALL